MKQGTAIRILTYSGDLDWLEDQLKLSMKDGDVRQFKKGRITCREIIRTAKLSRAMRQYYRRLFIWEEEDTFPKLVATLGGYFVDFWNNEDPLGPFSTLLEAKAERLDFCNNWETE